MNSLLKLPAAFPLWEKYSNSATTFQKFSPLHPTTLPPTLISISVFQFNIHLLNLVEPIQVPVFPRGSFTFQIVRSSSCAWIVSEFTRKFLDLDYISLKLGRTLGWHPTPVLLSGKSHGHRSLVGCSPWGCKELDTAEET